MPSDLISILRKEREYILLYKSFGFFIKTHVIIQIIFIYSHTKYKREREREREMKSNKATFFLGLLLVYAFCKFFARIQIYDLFIIHMSIY